MHQSLLQKRLDLLPANVGINIPNSTIAVTTKNTEGNIIDGPLATVVSLPKINSNQIGTEEVRRGNIAVSAVDSRVISDLSVDNADITPGAIYSSKSLS